MSFQALEYFNKITRLDVLKDAPSQISAHPSSYYIRKTEKAPASEKQLVNIIVGWLPSLGLQVEKES